MLGTTEAHSSSPGIGILSTRFGSSSSRSCTSLAGEQMDPDQPTMPGDESATAAETLEMPKPTAAPLVLALGVGLMAAGVVLGLAMTGVGGVLLFIGRRHWGF